MATTTSGRAAATGPSIGEAATHRVDRILQVFLGDGVYPILPCIQQLIGKLGHGIEGGFLFPKPFQPLRHRLQTCGTTLRVTAGTRATASAVSRHI